MSEDKQITENPKAFHSKEEAFASLQKIRYEALLQRMRDGSSIDFDYKEKYLEYLDERYGE